MKMNGNFEVTEVDGVKYFSPLGELSHDELNAYRDPESTKNSYGPEPLVKFRPDRDLMVEGNVEGIEGLTKVTGTTGYMVVGRQTVVYDRTGKILSNVTPKDRVAFEEPRTQGSGVRGTGSDRGVAILEENLPKYLHIPIEGKLSDYAKQAGIDVIE